MLQIGELRHRITILEPAVTGRTKAGEEIKDPQEFKSVWASVEPLVGNQFIAAQQAGSEISVKIRTHFFTGVKAGWLVKYGERTFEIVSPPIDYKELHRELILMCREVF